MNITTLEYGVVKVSSDLAIGSNIWSERTTNNIQVQDIIELSQGLVERCLCTQFGEDTTPPDYNGDTEVYVLESDGTKNEYYFYKEYSNANGDVSSEDYKINYSNVEKVYVGNSCSIALTNDYYYNSGVNFGTMYPWTTNHSYETNYDQRYIIGYYESITVSGFPSEYSYFNGVYYSNENIFNVGYGLAKEDGTAYLTYNESVTYLYDNIFEGFQKTFSPLVNGNMTYNGFLPYTETPYITFTLGDLVKLNPDEEDETKIKYKIVSVPINKFVNLFNGWLIPNRLSSWGNTLGMIDGKLLGADYISHYPKYNRLMLPTEYNIDIYFQPYFINQAKFGVDYYDSRNDLNIDMDTLFTDIGGKITPSWGFYDNNFVPERVSQVLLPTASKLNIEKEMLTQRFKAIKYLNTSLCGGLSWKADKENNKVSGYGSGITFNGAFLSAVANLTYSTSDEAPYAYTRCFMRALTEDLNGYYFYIEACSGQLECSYLQPLFSAEMFFYAKTDKILPAPYFPVYPFNPITVDDNEYYEYGEPILESSYVKLNATSDTHIIDNEEELCDIVLGAVNPASTLCAEPTVSGSCSTKGFRVSNQDLMAQWSSLKYCVDDIV